MSRSIQRPIHAHAVAAIALAAILATPAIADAQRAETVLVPASGGLGADMPDIAARMTQAIERVARKNGLEPKLTDASRDDVFAVAGCSSDDDPCHQAVLRTLGAKTLILVHVGPGTGTTTAEVEIVVSRRGKASNVLKLPLSSTTTERLVAELEAAAPPAFGGTATTPTTDPPPTTLPPDPYGDPVPPDPIDQTTGTDNTLDPGEGTPFGEPTNADQAGNTTGDATVPPEATTPPTSGTTDPRADGGGYDFRRVRPMSWGIGGAGAGLMLTSFIFYAAASGKQGDIDNARANTAADIERIKDLESTGKTYATLGNTTFLLGLVGLGVGGYFIYRDAKVPASEGVAITPMVVPSGVGVGVTVRR